MDQAKQNNENIHTVHFEKLKEAPQQEIKAIKNFLGLDVSDDLIEEIAQKCHFQNLRKASVEVKEFPPELATFFEERKKIFPEMKFPTIYRKGEVGDWKNHFTVAQNERFDALYEKEMKDRCQKMTANNYYREGHFFKKDEDIEFGMLTVDGIGLPAFPPTRLPGGFPQRINEIINLDTRPDDVLLATYPKCGTHWTSEILDMLVRGNADYSKETKVKLMEALPDMSMLEDMKSRRVLNTHLPYKWFPAKLIENGGKIIHTTRNPKDAYVSFFHHCASNLEFGQKTMGMTWSQFFYTCVIGKDCLYGTWFDYEKEMHQAKQNNRNIHTVHFENLKMEPEQEIKAIATFLDIQASDDLIKEIALKCHFPNLKKANDEVKEIPKEFRRLFEEQKKLFPNSQLLNIYRKGIVGDWKNHFTVAQNDQFDALYQKEVNDIDIKVIF